MKMKKTLSLAVAAVVAIPSFSAFAMEQSAFDSGMKRGIEYFSKGLYYEARDEFQWFADYNWGKLNDGQQKYLLDYLDGAKQSIVDLNNAKASTEMNMPTSVFDNGIQKGIEYFNKGLYYEAKDEFQWFCDANWGRMNEGQQKYVLDYLGSSRKMIQNLEQSVIYHNDKQKNTQNNISNSVFQRDKYNSSMQTTRVIHNYWAEEGAVIVSFDPSSTLVKYKTKCPVCGKVDNGTITASIQGYGSNGTAVCKNPNCANWGKSFKVAIRHSRNVEY